jgi:hypothetical protein
MAICQNLTVQFTAQSCIPFDSAFSSANKLSEGLQAHPGTLRESEADLFGTRRPLPRSDFLGSGAFQFPSLFFRSYADDSCQQHGGSCSKSPM